MTKTPVAILGVSPLSLIIGRACSLSDSPIVGLFDPDHSKALRASLLLGTSALDAPAKLVHQTQRSGVLLLSKPNLLNHNEPVNESGHQEGLRFLLTFHLYPKPNQVCQQNAPQCWLKEVTPTPTYDETIISSQVPPLTFALEGPRESQTLAQEWLEALSEAFSVSSGKC